MITRALWLVSISVAFGALSGTVSVITGLRGHSLSVLAVGLGVLADVAGSAVLIWRFRAERHQPGRPGAQETQAAIIVSVALAVVSAVLTAESVTALVSGSRPGTSAITLIAAAVSLAVLVPLAYAKRRLGQQMASRALQGDGALSGIGAATSLLALISLALYHALGWWWADRIAALAVAVVAAAEAWRTAPRRSSPGRLRPRKSVGTCGAAGPSGGTASAGQLFQIWNSETCPAGHPVLAVKFSRTYL